MSAERDFLHHISNHLATAKLSMELGLEILAESPSTDRAVGDALRASLTALEKLSQAIMERRQKLE